MRLNFAFPSVNIPAVNTKLPAFRSNSSDSVYFGNSRATKTELPSVEAFYSNIPNEVERFHRISSGILKSLLDNDASPLALDHAYIATSNATDYQHCKQLLQSQNQGEQLKEHPNFNGRRLSVWKLDKPWVVQDNLDQHHSVRYLEMGEPKPGRPEDNGIAHIAYQVDQNLSEHPMVVDILKGQPKTISIPEGAFTLSSARIDSYGGLKLKTTIDQKPFEIEVRRDSIVDTV